MVDIDNSKGNLDININNNIQLYNCDCIELMRDNIADKSIDLIITSPPYDNLRTYNGHVDSFTSKFNDIANELYRILIDNGVLVWIVGDSTINGSETLTSFNQALYFKSIGFNVHDTMIYKKRSFAPIFPGGNRYQNCFEYMFILSKGKPKTFNPLMRQKAESSIYERATRSSYRNKDGTMKYKDKIDTSRKDTIELNVWDINCGYMKSSKDKISYKHPATFPEELAERHILTWSNMGDIIFDPMMGSGTVAKMCKKLNRNFIGSEIDPEYFKIAEQRINL